MVAVAERPAADHAVRWGDGARVAVVLLKLGDRVEAYRCYDPADEPLVAAWERSALPPGRRYARLLHRELDALRAGLRAG